MDDIGVWERALADEEILPLYNAPAPTVGYRFISVELGSPATIDDGSCDLRP